MSQLRRAFFICLVCVLVAWAPSAATAAGPGGATASAPAGGGSGGGASTSTVPPPEHHADARPSGGSSVRLARRGGHALARGARGHAVRVLQDRLTRAGFPTPVAGVFGPQTERNVKAFQRQQQLPADGVVTPRVAAVLKRAVRSHAALQQPPATTDPTTPAGSATLLPDGTAVAPADAPPAVAAVIAAANQIATTPYRWGGGHRRWDDSGYDCSGSVSFALHGGSLLDVAEDSGELMTYGADGPGRWITLYANPDHVYMVVAGLRYDTSGAKPSRWQSAMRPTAGFTVRHPVGY